LVGTGFSFTLVEELFYGNCQQGMTQCLAQACNLRRHQTGNFQQVIYFKEMLYRSIAYDFPAL
jgi:hypothetical protein